MMNMGLFSESWQCDHAFFLCFSMGILGQSLESRSSKRVGKSLHLARCLSVSLVLQGFVHPKSREVTSQPSFPKANKNSYWCLVGNGWEWGNGMIMTSDCGSFPHSLLSISKNLLNAHHFCSTNWGTPSQDLQLGPPSGWSFQSDRGMSWIWIQNDGYSSISTLV